MRRALAIVFLVVASSFVIGVTGCGQTSQVSLAGGDQSPQALMTAAIAASETMKAATGTLDVSLSYDVDTAQMPAENKAFFDKPMTLSGTFAYADNPRAGDFALSLSAAGEAMDVGMKLIDNKFWLSLRDQWYEAPAEMQQMMSESFDQQTKLNELKSLLNELGIDPVTWFKDLRLVGEETIAGTDVYHLAGSPDTARIMTDIVGLMNSKEFVGLIDPTGSMTGTMGVDELVPSADEMREMQTQLAEMFRDFTIDVWVGKKDSLLRKIALELNMVPPTGEEADGLKGIAMKAWIQLGDPGETVQVAAPASALPFSELERAMQDDPEMFMGPFMGLMGGLGGFGMGDVTF